MIRDPHDLTEEAERDHFLRELQEIARMEERLDRKELALDKRKEKIAKEMQDIIGVLKHESNEAKKGALNDRFERLDRSLVRLSTLEHTLEQRRASLEEREAYDLGQVAMSGVR